MSVFQQLQAASYKNISFLVPNEEKEGGRKTVTHEYPDSNRRYIEDLGRLPASYSITAIISGTDAIARRIRFEQALEEGGRGLLVHPSLGQLTVTPTNYSSRSSDTEVGKFIFDITFKESAKNITLTPSTKSVQYVSSLASTAQSSLDYAFVSKYVDTSTVSVLQSAASSVADLLDQIESAANNIENADSDYVSTFEIVMNAVENTFNVDVRYGQDLIESIRNIYDSYESITTNIGDYFSGYEDLTTYGDDRTEKDLITQIRIDEETNLSAIEDQTRLNALIGMYESAAYTDYDTDEELQAAQQTLADKYKDLVQNAEEGSLAYDNDFRNDLNNLRIAARSIFEEKQQNIWKVVDIYPNESSMAITAHRYYGDLDELDTLKNLNKGINAAYFNESIKGLT